MEKPSDPRSVESLGDDARNVDDQGINQHQWQDDRRSDESENPKRQNGQPMSQFSSTGFDQEAFKIRRRKISKAFFFIPVSKDLPTVGKAFFPTSHPEDRLIYQTFFFPFVGSKPKAVGSIPRIANFQASPRNGDLNKGPEEKTDQNRPFVR